jgi:hypothetical protein
MKVIIIAIFLVLLVNPCLAQKSDSEILITIERKACFGSCSVYSARIYTDGTVIYNGVDFVKVIGEKRYKIAEERVKRLLEAFEKADYFSFKDEYRFDENGMSVTDQPTTITSIVLNGKKKQVINYYKAPKELEKLETAIEFLADLDRNIGPL